MAPTTPRPARPARWFTLTTSALAASAVVLAGCSSTPADDATTTTPPTSATSTDTTSAEPVSVKYWHRLPSVEGAKTVDDLVAEWNDANPDIQVTAEAMQGAPNESYAKIAAAVEAGDGPCLAQVGTDRVPDLLSTGQLLDVTEHASQYADAYLDYAWGRVTFGDRTYGIPQDTGPIVLYYRTDVFDEHDIDVPTTWEEYRAAGEKLQAADPDAYIGAFLPDETMWMMALASANGASWWGIDGDAWRVSVNDEPTREVAQYWQGLIDDEIVATIPRWDPRFDAAINDGTLVATIGASWEAPLIAGATPDTAGSWGVAQVPAWDAANPLVGEDGGSVVAALKGCETPAQAVEFANWLNTNVDGLMPLGLFPATKAPAGGFATPEALTEFFGGQAVYEEFSTANANVNVDWSFSPTTGVTMTAISDAVGQMLEGGPRYVEVFDIAQKSSVDSLKAAGISVVE